MPLVPVQAVAVDELLTDLETGIRGLSGGCPAGGDDVDRATISVSVSIARTRSHENITAPLSTTIATTRLFPRSQSIDNARSRTEREITSALNNTVCPLAIIRLYNYQLRCRPCHPR